MQARSIDNIQPFENLKVFKILGYYGRTIDSQLAEYVICNAVSLEKVVIHPRRQDQIPIYRQKVCGNVLLKEETTRSSSENKLESIIARKSPSVKFVVL